VNNGKDKSQRKPSYSSSKGSGKARSRKGSSRKASSREEANPLGLKSLPY